MPDLIDVLTSEVTELYYEVNSLKDFVEKQQNLISFEPTAVNNDNQHLENLIYLVEVIRTNLKNIKIELCYTQNSNSKKNLSILTKIKKLISGLMA